MSYNPAKGFPRVMPSLRYEEVGKALTWLSHVFGLKEHLRWADENGIVGHNESPYRRFHIRHILLHRMSATPTDYASA